MLYKLKTNDDDSWDLQSRITPHQNKDDEKAFLTKICVACSHTCIRVLESLAPFIGYTIYKEETKSAIYKKVQKLVMYF